jgi:hypothetical protein
LPRVALLGAWGAWAWLEVERSAFADDSIAPASVQAQILTRILPFDRGFAGRVGSGNVMVDLVQIGDDADSTSTVLHMGKELADIGQVAEHPLHLRTVNFRSAAELAAGAHANGSHAVYLSAGLGPQVPAIAAAFVGSGVLTFGCAEAYVPNGAVMGVAILAGKPRISVNLAQARAQDIDFPASVLRLAKVY